MCVGLYEFPDRQPIGCFFGGNGDVFTHKLVSKGWCGVLRHTTAQSSENRFRFKVCFDSVCPKFTANARILESAEWRLLVIKQAVDGYAAGLNLSRDATGALNVRAADVCVE